MPDVISGQAAVNAPDPVAMISALLDAEKVTPDAKPEAKAAEVTPETAQPEAEAETGSNNAQVEGEDAQPTEGVSEIPLEQLEAIELEVTVQGQKQKLPIKALREGYMRQEDYSRKTAEVARQREEVGNSVRQAVEGERTQYQQNLQQLQALVTEAVAPELKDVNWNHLATNDPAEYVRLRNRADQVKNVLETIKTRGEELTARQKQEQSQVLQETARKARVQLDSDIPGFNDALYQNLIKSSENYGYKAEEVAQWVDPRAIKVLNDAYQFQQLKAGKPAADKKVAVAPPVVKSAAKPAVSKQSQQANNALERLRKTGHRDAMADFLAASMK